MIIFQSSAKHAALNFLQWEYGSFAPIFPFCMRADLPTENDRGKITKQFIIESLPGPKLCIRTAGIAFTLTEFSEDEVFLLLHQKFQKNRRRKTLGTLKTQSNKVVYLRQLTTQHDILSDLTMAKGLIPPRWLFTEEKATTAFLAFQHKLQQIEDEIVERNTALEQSGSVPYEALLPSRIPSGIAI